MTTTPHLSRRIGPTAPAAARGATTATATPTTAATAAAANRPRGTAGRGAPRLRAMVPDVVRAVVDRIDAGPPEIAAARWRHRAAEASSLQSDLFRRLELSARDADPEAADLARLTRFGTRAARRGVPLPAVQAYLRLIVVETFRELWARAEPSDVGDVMRLCRWQAGYHRTSEALLAELYARTTGHVEPGAAVAARLLTGLPVGPGHHHPATPIAAVNLVVALTGPVDLPPGTLTAVVDGTSYALVPVPDPAAGAAVRAAVRRSVEAAPGVLATAAVAATPQDVPAAAAATGKLLRTAVAVGRAPGLVESHDLVLETALADNPEGLGNLAAAVAPLAAEERLRVTLRTFLRLGLDRTTTAAELGISRSGLTLRLDRIQELTGLDPRSPRGIQVLGTALSACALLQPRPGGEPVPAAPRRAS